MKFGESLILVAVFACCAESAHGNTGFENGDFSGWTTQGSGWSITEKMVFEGEKAAMCSITKREPATLKACVLLVDKAKAGWVVKADLQVMGKARSKSSSMTASIVCIDSAGEVLRESKKTLSTAPKEYQRISLPEVIVPSGTEETYLMLVVELKDEAKGNEWWRFDDVVVQVK